MAMPTYYFFVLLCIITSLSPSILYKLYGHREEEEKKKKKKERYSFDSLFLSYTVCRLLLLLFYSIRDWFFPIDAVLMLEQFKSSPRSIEMNYNSSTSSIGTNRLYTNLAMDIEQQGVKSAS